MTATVQAAHAAGKKVILTVGGWGSDFRDAVSPSYRSESILNLVQYMRTYGYDGIDIDWEPVQDAPNYALWIRDLRTAMRAFNPNALLATAAFSFDQAIVDNQQQFDQINLMTYDMAGPWPGWVSWHNSPVFDGGFRFPSTGGLVPSANGSIDQYIAASVPRTKLGIGTDFLGYYWMGGDGSPTGGVTAPRQSYTTTPQVRSNVQYYEIMDTYGGYPQLWDSSAQAAFISIDLPGSQNDKFISFDNERTMYAKAEYVRSKGIGGVIVFELGAGYRTDQPPGQKDLLLQAIKKAFILGERYVPDTTPPTVSLISPTQGATVGGTITLAAQASDNSGIVSVQFIVDGAQYRSRLVIPPFSTPLNTWKLANGTHRITAFASDRSGNYDSASTTITVNNQGLPPKVQPLIVYDELLASPFHNSSWGAHANLDSRANVRSGLQAIKIDYLDWGALDFTSGTGLSPSPIDPSVYDTLQFDVFPPCSFDLTVAFYNGVTVQRPLQANTWNHVIVPLLFADPFTRFYFQRNLAGGATVYFDNIMFTGFGGAPPIPPPVPDTLKPSVSIVSPVQGATVNGVITVTTFATDEIAVTGVQLRVDGRNVESEIVESPFAFRLNTWRYVNGIHSLTAVARDRGGHRDSVTTQVRIDNQGTPPSFDWVIYDDALLAPFNNTSWGATIDFCNTERVKSGTAAIRADFTGWGAFDLLCGTWGALIPIKPAEFDSLSFDVYPLESFSLDVEFYCNYTFSQSLTANTWQRVCVPLRLDTTFTRFYFRRNLEGTATAYFDNLRLISTVDPGKTGGIDEPLPVDYALDQNYPNPFNPSTTIQFSIPADGPVRMILYDLLGREITRLVDGRVTAGTHRIFVEAEALRLSTGVYFYRLEAGSFVETRRMLLIH
jgi:chitinase